MKLILDFETRSPVDIRGEGMYKYCLSPRTEIMCMAWKLDAGPVKLWYSFPTIVQDTFPEDLIQDPGVVLCAHNAGFERLILRTLGIRLPIERFTCTAAKAAAAGLPRSLEGAGAALGLGQQKDPAGKRLMLKLCKPRKDGSYPGTSAEYRYLGDYCRQDVEAEYVLDRALPDLSPAETAVWRLDQAINDRGFLADWESIREILAKLGENEADLLLEIEQLTQGAIQSPRQVAESLTWLNSQGVNLYDLTAESVTSALETPVAGVPRRFLEIRQEMARSSCAKYQAFLDYRHPVTGRIHGAYMYHGAATGRWTARGVQPHNLPRGALGADTEAALFMLAYGDRRDVAAFGALPAVASGCVRSVIVAAPGKEFFAADFSNIEGRVAAWVAREAWKVKAFSDFDAGQGADLYCLAYAKAFGLPVEKVDSDQRRIGKVMELALQYQGWKGAFAKMARNYGVDLPEEQVVRLCSGWREAHPRIVAAWAEIHRHAMGLVREVQGALRIALPSGRRLVYQEPRITPGYEGEVLSYEAVENGKWKHVQTYGGMLFENYVQATARDILAEAMLRIEKAGFPIVLHVHDEIVAEVYGGDFERFLALMREVPPWAAGLPVAVSGWRGRRYRKG